MTPAARLSPALRRRFLISFVASLVAVIGTTVGIRACGNNDSDSRAQGAVDGFVTAWRTGALSEVHYANAGNVPALYAKAAGDFVGETPKLAAGDVSTDGDKGHAKVHVTWGLGSGQTWRYDTTVQLRKQGGEDWRIVWSPAILHPKLKGDDALQVRRGVANRGDIRGGGDALLVTERPVIQVDVVPREVPDPNALATTLGAKLSADDVDSAELRKHIRGAKPDERVEVVTLRRERYDAVKSAIHDLPGVHFTEATMPLPPRREFARAVLGAVGPVTKEEMTAHPGRYRIGDQVGKGGLQQRYQDLLASSADVTIETTSGLKLVSFAGKVGQQLTTTLDLRTQDAADNALASQDKQSALVAIRVSDGAILAAANGPSTSGVNLAFEAATAPGSTFKMVSGWGYLNAGVTPDQTVPCPKYVTAGGKRFQNDHEFELGDVPFHTDFAQSCNTAFAGLAPKLGNDGLAKAGKELGIGTKWSVGLDAHTGSIATGGSDAEKAAAVFGQGKTTVSPLAMAAATAAVARGQWRQPVLVTGPAQQKTADGKKLDGHLIGQLREMMCEVVTKGTATALRSVPGEPVCGKTGTAEYGNEQPPHSHGWFVGYQGDIAFAVFVNDGGSSAPAVDIAGRFLRALPR
ncbi:MAG: penicillin-binding protein [Acidimicrobiales bacterium]|nr:MAG: penicillin-binding protein [Acidimicrobiales bacterium]